MTDVLRAYEGGRARNCNAKASCRLASVLQPLARTRTLASKSHASRATPEAPQQPVHDGAGLKENPFRLGGELASPAARRLARTGGREAALRALHT